MMIAVKGIALAAGGLLVAASSTAAADAASRRARCLEQRPLDVAALSLEELLDVEIVVAATKREQRAEEAPAIVTVVTRDEIRQWGYRSVGEALSHVVGFYVVDDHIVPNVAVRGVSGGLRAESGIIKLMIDGHTVAFRSTAGNWLGPELIAMSAVERIEIVRGPASALYGADAFLGVVNVITRKSGDLAGGDVVLGAGATGGNPGGGHELTMGGVQGEWDGMLAMRLHTEDRSGLALPGTSPAPRVPAYARDLDADGLTLHSGSGLARMTRQLGDLGELTVTSYLAGIDRGAEFADWTQLANGLDRDGRLADNRVSLWQGFVDARAVLDLSCALTVTLDAMVFAGGPTARDRIEVGSNLYYVERELGYRGTEIQGEAAWSVTPGLTLLAGTDFMFDREQLPSNLHILKVPTDDLDAGEVREETSTRQGKLSLINTGLRLQADWAALTALTLTGGLRYDYHNIYGHQVSGRAGAVWRPLDRLHLKLLYGSAFKAPSPLLLYGVPYTAGDIIGNRDLSPQRVHTFETLATWKPLDRLTVSSGLAYNLLLEKAEFTQQGVNRVARNVAEFHGLSWETQVQADFQRVRGYLATEILLAARQGEEQGYQAELVGNRIEIYPPAMAHAGVAGRVPGLPVSLSLEASAIASRRATDGNILEAGEVYRLDPLLLLGATAATTPFELLPGKETVVRLIGRNLTGARGPDPGFSGVDYPLTARLVWLQLEQEL
jgi:outer membrane receptor protein involved in Fe transport